MRQSPEDNRRIKGGKKSWDDESRDADSMHIPPNSGTSTVNLILREQYVELRTLISLL